MRWSEGAAMAHAAACRTSGMPWKRWTAAGKRKTQKLRPIQKKTSTHVPKPCHGKPQIVRLAPREQRQGEKPNRHRPELGQCQTRCRCRWGVSSRQAARALRCQSSRLNLRFVRKEQRRLGKGSKARSKLGAVSWRLRRARRANSDPTVPPWCGTPSKNTNTW